MKKTRFFQLLAVAAVCLLSVAPRAVADDAKYVKLVNAGTGKVLSVEEAGLDFRGGREIGTTVLDHCFTGLARDGDGRASARLTAPGGTEVGLWADDRFTHLMVFTGDTLEPDRAVVLLEKEWDVAGANASAGIEDERLTFRPIAGEWKIAGEEESNIRLILR